MLRIEIEIEGCDLSPGAAARLLRCIAEDYAERVERGDWKHPYGGGFHAHTSKHRAAWHVTKTVPVGKPRRKADLCKRGFR